MRLVSSTSGGGGFDSSLPSIYSIKHLILLVKSPCPGGRLLKARVCSHSSTLPYAFRSVWKCLPCCFVFQSSPVMVPCSSRTWDRERWHIFEGTYLWFAYSIQKYLATIKKGSIASVYSHINFPNPAVNSTSANSNRIYVWCSGATANPQRTGQGLCQGISVIHWFEHRMFLSFTHIDLVLL